MIKDVSILASASARNVQHIPSATERFFEYYRKLIFRVYDRKISLEDLPGMGPDDGYRIDLIAYDNKSYWSLK